MINRSGKEGCLSQAEEWCRKAGKVGWIAALTDRLGRHNMVRGKRETLEISNMGYKK